ncbi:MAG: hypothetical protein WAM14_09015 [Candidatus Nitrosopolaris sp.]
MTNTLIPFAGSGLVGYAMGFALHKIIKWLMILSGVLAGSFFLGIEMLQKYGYVGEIKCDKLGNGQQCNHGQQISIQTICKYYIT